MTDDTDATDPYADDPHRDETPRSGGCQCGRVRFHARALIGNPHVCHCRMCQKATGNFFAALVGAQHKDLDWTRGTPATFASSDGHERGFCAACGTPLYYRSLSGGHVSLCIGAFDDPASIPIRYEFGMEGRLPQIDQFGHVETGVTEENDPDWAAAIARSNRQHPDHDTDGWEPAA